MRKIHPCLCFNNQAEAAARFYTSLFKKGGIGKIAYYGEAGARISGQEKGSVLTVEFSIENQIITALNGGPQFEFTPALSFLVWCETEEEIAKLWHKLSEGGKVRMGMDSYPWAPKYGWTADKFGVEWQLMLSPHKQKIAPTLLFVKDLFGKGEEALQFYMSLFHNSKVEFMARDEATRSIAHCVFTIDEQPFVLMDGQGEHDFTFTPAFSLMVICQTQEEVDEYWENLAEAGTKGQCGWLTDKYGVSWQIVPAILPGLMSDPKKSEAAMSALLKMTKPDINKLKQVYEQS